MRFKLLITILIAQYSIATLKAYDLNNDKVNDRFEYYKGAVLLKVEEDRNNDKKIDLVKDYTNKDFFHIQRQDNNFDGKFERVISLKPHNKTKVKTITKVDRDGDGKYEISYFTIKDLDQKSVDCIEFLIDKKIASLGSNVFDATASLGEGFIPTDFGYKIDRACLSNWGDDFIQTLNDTMKEGLACFSELAKKSNSKTTSGVLRNAHELIKLQEENNIKIVCSEKDYDWSTTEAHASTQKGQSLKSKGIEHPYISINSNYPQVKSDPTNTEVAGIKSTLFHEQLHNLGYLHTEDVEYPYTCETCCFADDNSDNEQVEKACKVCTGNYASDTDIKYIDDFVDYSIGNYDRVNATKATVKFLKENPNSTEGISILANISSGIFSPIGHNLAKRIEEEHGPSLSQKDKENIADAKAIRSPLASDSGKVIADAYYEIYFEKDGSKALDNLERNKEKILKAFKSLENNENEYETYTSQEMSTHLYNIIYDLWVNEYTDSQNKNNSTRAYDLYNDFKPYL